MITPAQASYFGLEVVVKLDLPAPVSIFNKVSWFYVGEGEDQIDIYLRKTLRIIDREKVPCLDVGSVSTQVQGRGSFSDILPEIERLADRYQLAIYVENVLSPRFCAFFERRGYVKLKGSSAEQDLTPCFLRNKKS